LIWSIQLPTPAGFNLEVVQEAAVPAHEDSGEQPDEGVGEHDPAADPVAIDSADLLLEEYEESGIIWMAYDD
jgi:hypothetical protein